MTRSFLRRLSFAALGFAAAFSFSSCSIGRDTRNQMIVSVKDQKMLLVRDGKPVKTYPVSTSKFGIGDRPGTNHTPLGKLEIAQKIGDHAPLGAVFKSRRRTGEIIKPDAPGRDPIVTRIMWLRGTEDHNSNAYRRYIYIHGTPEARRLGTPASYGCIRMGCKDVADLYNRVGTGAKVIITRDPLEATPEGHAYASMTPHVGRQG